VDVNVNETWGYIQRRNIHNAARYVSGYVWCDCRYLSRRNGHVAHTTDSVLCIDHMAALEQKIILLLSGSGSHKSSQKQQSGKSGKVAMGSVHARSL
jgi:hypothetical protein